MAAPVSMAVPLVNQIRAYWWCRPPRTGRAWMRELEQFRAECAALPTLGNAHLADQLSASAGRGRAHLRRPPPAPLRRDPRDASAVCPHNLVPAPRIAGRPGRRTLMHGLKSMAKRGRIGCPFRKFHPSWSAVEVQTISKPQLFGRSNNGNSVPVDEGEGLRD